MNAACLTKGLGMNAACLPEGPAGLKPRPHVSMIVFASNLRRKWQKNAVMNDFFDKKAEKPGRIAKFSAIIVHNRKKVTENCFITVMPE